MTLTDALTGVCGIVTWNVTTASLEGHLLQIEIVAALARGALRELVEDKFGRLMRLLAVVRHVGSSSGLVGLTYCVLAVPVFLVG